MTSGTGSTPLACAAEVGRFFDGVFGRLELWRAEVVRLAPGLAPSHLDEAVRRLVEASLTDADPLLVGAGFIAGPGIVPGEGLHFAWWLGPLDANPLLGTTTGPTMLDMSTRDYVDYIQDFRTLEWYEGPSTTRQRHITGPYVDHLCTCDYILTLTVPAERAGVPLGVVGADLSVKRLERELLPLLRRLDAPAALVNRLGRVLVSTDPLRPPGALLSPGEPGAEPPGLPCPGTSFRLTLTGAPSAPGAAAPAGL